MKRLIKLVFGNELFESLFAFLVFVLLLLTSCASNEVRSQEILLRHADKGEGDKLNNELVQRKAEFRKVSAITDYKIGPEDLVEIDVFGTPELKTTARVSGSGFIKMSLIDTVEAGGHTVAELESIIATRLKQYLREPVVSVFVREYRSQQISVIGSVQKPQVLYVTGQKYLLDVISLSGGLTPDAGTLCIIQRVSELDPNNKEGFTKIVIDLNELLTQGKAELNIPVFSGDIVQVPKSEVFFVEGAVRGPGSIPLRGKTTLIQAISMANGLSFEALHSDIKIYRKSEKSGFGVQTVDYDDILEGKAPDVEVKEKDIIIVGRNGFKTLISGISGALNFGMFSMGKGNLVP